MNWENSVVFSTESSFFFFYVFGVRIFVREDDANALFRLLKTSSETIRTFFTFLEVCREVFF
ncbi:MAG: hypothetical protein EAZ92_17790 [Candidatus Kapaibacterium sp.]|nr:MAG: hypothetical protein EAZ92_17790 [Candidatus Kapabacteria bacterium]